MNFKNMKIEINKDQPLDEVVSELERLCYIKWAWTGDECNWVQTWDDAEYTNAYELDKSELDYHTTITLAELKEMK